MSYLIPGKQFRNDDGWRLHSVEPGNSSLEGASDLNANSLSSGKNRRALPVSSNSWRVSVAWMDSGHVLLWRPYTEMLSQYPQRLNQNCCHQDEKHITLQNRFC
jgi:hypothetical protein